MSRVAVHQTAEIHIRIAIMNTVSLLGRAEIKAVARVQAGKPGPTSAPLLCNIADARQARRQAGKTSSLCDLFTKISPLH
ncbi:hypothetical protein AL036_21515 [Salipiger aestuarii]|nr:hypothetical protein AL036_21515 [Salipiger aestuarii]KAB2533450.1 hypothetical protein AL035_20755 [Salipiger aestuarii]